MFSFMYLHYFHLIRWICLFFHFFFFFFLFVQFELKLGSGSFCFCSCHFILIMAIYFVLFYTQSVFSSRVFHTCLNLSCHAMPCRIHTTWLTKITCLFLCLQSINGKKRTKNYLKWKKKTELFQVATVYSRAQCSHLNICSVKRNRNEFGYYIKKDEE